MLEIFSIGTSQPPRGARTDRGWTVELGSLNLECPADFAELLMEREDALEDRLQVFEYRKQVGVILKLPVDVIVIDKPKPEMLGTYGVVLIQMPREGYMIIALRGNNARLLYDGRNDELAPRLPQKYPNLSFVIARESAEASIQCDLLEVGTVTQFRLSVDACGARITEYEIDTAR